MCLFCEKQAETTEQLCAHMEVRRLISSCSAQRGRRPHRGLARLHPCSWSTFHSGGRQAMPSCPRPGGMEGGEGRGRAQVWSYSSSGKDLERRAEIPSVCVPFFIKKLEASGSEPVSTQDVLGRTLPTPPERGQPCLRTALWLDSGLRADCAAVQFRTCPCPPVPTCATGSSAACPPSLLPGQRLLSTVRTGRV